MTRLFLAAERDVVWCLPGTVTASPASDTAHRMGAVSRTVAQLISHGVAVTLVCGPETLDDEQVAKQLESLKPQAIIERPVNRSLGIVDREMVVIRHTDAETTGASKGMVIHDPTVADTLHHLLTSTARPKAPPAYFGTTSDAARRRNTIRVLELMMKGYTDDAAAKEAGMSVRTYRRHVASLMSELGANSRFQAGVLAAHSGLLRTRRASRP
ncbi:response regulator transcription factor [Streptomyces sp. NPDC052042]|uniref:response regulator transcription factor n=1 Tax=Streptomyces sp. NPDC052042 TaxID=3365683 RepID=UPI0037D756E7